MPDPLSTISTRRTPQTEMADPRQVPNSAGGFTFEVTPEARIMRFLTIGVDGPTYYATEREVTKDNAAVVLDWARNRSSELVALAVEISVAGRAPRNNAALFALAAAAGLGDDTGRKAALDALPLVARTGTHLFIFAGYVQQFRGWGRGLRRAVGDWYLNKTPDDLAYQILKYRQRNGWTHRDMLRLSHPKTGSDLLGWLTGKEFSEHPLIHDFMCAQAATTVKEWVDLLAANRSLSWEMLPDAALGERRVWEQLLDNGLPQTALMRQLPRLTRMGVFDDWARARTVAAQLAHSGRLIKARVHPINLLVALRTYASGQSARGTGTWAPNAKIIDALDAAFYAAFPAVVPSGKRTLLALDVSGSMTWVNIGGMPITPREASAALALVTAATEPDHEIMAFSQGIVPCSISPRQRLDDAIRAIERLPASGTDCSLPMLWALERRIEVDCFVILTDNETNSSWSIHPHQALRLYRERTGIAAKLIVCGMTATNFTIADPADVGSMDVVGFDSATPGLIADFSRGDI